MEKVTLPNPVAEEIQKLRNKGWGDYRIISYVHTRLQEPPILLSPMVRWADQYQNQFLRALADGFEVKQTPREKAIELLKKRVSFMFSARNTILEIEKIYGVNVDDR